MEWSTLDAQSEGELAMPLVHPPRRMTRAAFLLFAGTLLTLLAIPIAAAIGQQRSVDVLRIGTSGSIASLEPGTDEAGALSTLRDFIKTETGLNNEIHRQKDWRELAAKLAGKQVHVGVFLGYEFAWAQPGHQGLKPLALAVNIYRYPTVYVVTRRDSKATDFARLQGQPLAIPKVNEGYLHLFVDRQCETLGKKPDSFFARVTAPANVEDAIDDVVDGVIQAAAVDRAGLDGYKRRKPGRFNQLKAVAQSQPFPPPLVAYYDGVLDAGTLQRFRDGLLNAGNKERGQTLLTLFRLTGFEPVANDFDRVLAETRKAYPPPAK
jgi:ABC-type phosphate/phosphonate transport system substrate-binding protein